MAAAGFPAPLVDPSLVVSPGGLWRFQESQGAGGVIVVGPVKPRELGPSKVTTVPKIDSCPQHSPVAWNIRIVKSLVLVQEMAQRFTSALGIVGALVNRWRSSPW